jgi:predicted dinucleotide-binding enzyme
MRKKVAIVGAGNVGKALREGVERAGHEVRVAGRGQVSETAAWGDIVILAVPFAAIPDVVRELKTAADGKPVVDVTNALTPDMQLALGFSTSDDEAARKAVLELGKTIGFDAIDAGPLKNARHLEALGYLNIQLGYVLGHGPNIGFKLAH